MTVAEQPSSPSPQIEQPQYAPAPPVAAGAPGDPRRRSPRLAMFLSFVPGLGQVYVGYYPRGFLNALVVAGLVAFLASEPYGDLIPLAAIFLAFFYFHNIVDAGRRAMLYNVVLAGEGDVELPADFKAPGIGGSILGGTLLVVAGFVLLLNTRFGMSLAWIEEWWPLGLIGFGAYLLFKAIRERSSLQPSTGE